MTEEQQRLAVAEIGHCHAVSGEPGEHGDHTGWHRHHSLMLANEHSFTSSAEGHRLYSLPLPGHLGFRSAGHITGPFSRHDLQLPIRSLFSHIGAFLLIQHCAKLTMCGTGGGPVAPNKPKVEVTENQRGALLPLLKSQPYAIPRAEPNPLPGRFVLPQVNHCFLRTYTPLCRTACWVLCPHPKPHEHLLCHPSQPLFLNWEHDSPAVPP